jgi:hypothetical protein
MKFGQLAACSAHVAPVRNHVLTPEVRTALPTQLARPHWPPPHVQRAVHTVAMERTTIPANASVTEGIGRRAGARHSVTNRESGKLDL